MLVDCKSWGGPCASVDELQLILRQNPDQSEKIINSEMAFYLHTHKADKIEWPETFRLNGIATEEKLGNLIILLNEKSITKAIITNLPTNSETFSAITGQKYKPAGNEVMCNQANKLCIVKWLVSANEYQWYIGCIKQEVEYEFVINHLHQVSEKTNRQWT